MIRSRFKVTQVCLFWLAFTLFLWSGGLRSAFAQSCCGNHLEPQFNQFSVSDTVYAADQKNFNGTFSNLSVRIWDAVGNDCPSKPLLLCIHGGGFTAGFPSLMDSICRSFASRGYLAASIQYRLGWIGSGYCSADTTEAIRAWYRAIGDSQKATFFFKDNYARYGIDSNLIFLCGWSAGGYAAAGAAFLDELSEKPQVCDSIESFVLPTNQTILRPDLGILPSFSRDPGYKGVITFSSSMLFPGLLNQGSNEPVLAFNNQNDPYLIPISTEAAWWSIDNCAELYPLSMGWSSDALQDYGELIEQHVFQENVCPHNLHDPCFPLWNQEIDIMSAFMNGKMNCDVVLDDREIHLKSVSTALVCSSLSEVKSILDKNAFWKLYSPVGHLVATKSSELEVLSYGCYYLHLEKDNQVMLICYSQ